MWQSPPFKISQQEQATCHNPPLTKLTSQILPRHHLLHLTHETLTLIFSTPTSTTGSRRPSIVNSPELCHHQNHRSSICNSSEHHRTTSFTLQRDQRIHLLLVGHHSRSSTSIADLHLRTTTSTQIRTIAATHKQPRRKTLLERSHREQPHCICNAPDLQAAAPANPSRCRNHLAHQQPPQLQHAPTPTTT